MLLCERLFGFIGKMHSGNRLRLTEYHTCGGIDGCLSVLGGQLNTWKRAKTQSCSSTHQQPNFQTTLLCQHGHPKGWRHVYRAFTYTRGKLTHCSLTWQNWYSPRHIIYNPLYSHSNHETKEHRDTISHHCLKQNNPP